MVSDQEIIFTQAAELMKSDSKRKGLKWLTDPRRDNIDRTIAILASLATSPFMAISLLSIWAYDGKNPIFVAARYHPKFSDLVLAKARTMQEGAHLLESKILGDGPYGHVKINGTDPRVTPIGSIFRKTSIDELPQLAWNVALKQNMSLIGPRPLVSAEICQITDLEEIAEYEKFVANLRLGMKFGLTGLSQLFTRASPNMMLKLRLDNLFASEANLAADYKIARQTFSSGVVLKGK